MKAVRDALRAWLDGWRPVGRCWGLVAAAVAPQAGSIRIAALASFAALYQRRR